MKFIIGMLVGFTIGEVLHDVADRIESIIETKEEKEND